MNKKSSKDTALDSKSSNTNYITQVAFSIAAITALHLLYNKNSYFKQLTEYTEKAKYLRHIIQNYEAVMTKGGEIFQNESKDPPKGVIYLKLVAFIENEPIDTKEILQKALEDTNKNIEWVMAPFYIFATFTAIGTISESSTYLQEQFCELTGLLCETNEAAV